MRSMRVDPVRDVKYMCVFVFRRETAPCCHQPVLCGGLHQWGDGHQQGSHVLTRQPHLDGQDDPGKHQISRLQQVTCLVLTGVWPVDCASQPGPDSQTCNLLSSDNTDSCNVSHRARQDQGCIVYHHTLRLILSFFWSEH